jgi:hypothetical protein
LRTNRLSPLPTSALHDLALSPAMMNLYCSDSSGFGPGMAMLLKTDLVMLQAVSLPVQYRFIIAVKLNRTIRGQLISAFRHNHTYVIPERWDYLLFVVIF